MIIRTVTPAGRLGKPKVIELQRPSHGSIDPVTLDNVDVSLQSVDGSVWIKITKAEYLMMHRWFS